MIFQHCIRITQKISVGHVLRKEFLVLLSFLGGNQRPAKINFIYSEDFKTLNMKASVFQTG